MSATSRRWLAQMAVPMEEWSVEDMLTWADCSQLHPCRTAPLPVEWTAALKVAFEEEEIDPDELANLQQNPCSGR